MSVWVKDSQGLEEGGVSSTTTSEAFIVELKAVPEPEILLIKPSAPNRGTARGFKTGSGSDRKGKSPQI